MNHYAYEIKSAEDLHYIFKHKVFPLSSSHSQVLDSLF